MDEKILLNLKDSVRYCKICGSKPKPQEMRIYKLTGIEPMLNLLYNHKLAFDGVLNSDGGYLHLLIHETM